jgi:F-type H+-transporting ATPase subunit a
MTLSDKLTETLKIETAFTVKAAGFEIPITETVIVTWAVMAICVVGALIWRGRLRQVPRGKQVFLEWAVEFCDSFCDTQLGKYGHIFADYIGTLFLFILMMNLIPVVSPVSGFGFTAPFDIKMPTRDINVTAALAVTTIIMVIVSAVATRGLLGWLKSFFAPMPFMLPFNILDYITKPLSLCMRLFGNMMAALVILTMIENVLPILLPIPVSAFFDWFDGTLQAVIFTFLTLIYLAEGMQVES